MRFVIALVATAVTAWATPALATDWYLVGISDNHTTASFVDKDSIADMGENMRRARTYQVFSETASDGSAAYNPYLEFDCVEPRYRFVSIKSVDINGNAFRDDEGSGKWRAIDKGSLDEAQQTFVCSNGARPANAVSYGAGPLIQRGRAKLNGTKSYGGH
ncbi:MAG: surface-adhesin E family protein [Sphingomonas sp.]|uniref:surface-adhesin E family protein n=1 Tax=Sphingomonas sp. TaxID=28214 RepID=UPI003F8142A3